MDAIETLSTAVKDDSCDQWNMFSQQDLDYLLDISDHVYQVRIELTQSTSLVTVTRYNTNDRLAQLCHHHHHGV